MTTQAWRGGDEAEWKQRRAAGLSLDLGRKQGLTHLTHGRSGGRLDEVPALARPGPQHGPSSLHVR